MLAAHRRNGAIFGFLALVAGACGSSSTPLPGTVGDAGGSHADAAGTDAGARDTGTARDSAASTHPDPGTLNGGFAFVFSNAATANVGRTDFRLTPVMGASCMGSAPASCSFSGSLNAGGCLATLSVAFVGSVTAGAAFPLVAMAPVAGGKGSLTYTESCGTDARTWSATTGTITLSLVNPPPQGQIVGTLSFTVLGANFSPAPDGAGTAEGTFDATGTGTEISYSGM